MNNYSYSEIQNMQKRAMERVREMQKNSDSILETARQDLGTPKTIEKTNDNQIRPKITNLPPNFPDFKEYFNVQSIPEETSESLEKPKERVSKSHFPGNIIDLISSEPDRALLIGLLLLLKSEGADETLMMALMYIMA